MLDVLIRKRPVYDGSGGKSFNATFGVRDGSIALVGKSGEPARRTVEAGGLALMAGHRRRAHALRRADHLDPTLSPSWRSASRPR